MAIGGFGPAGSGPTGNGKTSTAKKTGIGGFASTTPSPGSAPKGGVPGVSIAKKAAGDGLSLVGKALNVLDLARAGVLADLRAGGRLAQGKGFSKAEMDRQVKAHEGVGAIVANANLPMNVKRAIGFVGDVATDPLTYLTAGVGGAAKEATLLGAKGVAEEGARKAVKVTAEEAARELDAKGMREAANKVLARKSVNALTAEEAKAVGLRQGPTIGAFGRRLAIPGGDTAARAVSDVLAPITEKVHEVAPLAGRTSEAAKGLEPIAKLRLKDAEQAARLTAKGMADGHLTALRGILKGGALDKDAIRAALEGTGTSNPAAVQLRSILDSVAARTEELTGQRVPRIEHYLPHRLTDEAKAELAGTAARGRGTAAVMARAYKAGDKFLGTVLEHGSIDELNRIADEKGLGQLFKDDPIQLVHSYIEEMKSYAQRAGVPMRLSTDDVATKLIGAPGSRAARKGIKATEAEIAKLAADLESASRKVAVATEHGGEVKLAKAAELQGQGEALLGKGSTFGGPRVPSPEIEQAANAYIAREGLPAAQPVDRALQVDDAFATRLAHAYDALPSKGGPEATKAYKALADEVDKQYEYMTKELGIKVEFVGHDPYADAAEMMADVRQNKRLKVFTGGGEHPLLTPEQNNRFRAVHDFFGHAQAGNRFDRHGEEVAFRLHAQMFSPEALPAMATETRGQNAFLNYHPDNVARKAAGLAAEFPEQKAALLPPEFSAVVPAPNDLAERTVRTNGFTVNPTTGAVPKEGFAVSVRGAEEAFPPPSSPEELAQRIQAYVANHADQFAGGDAHLGGWVDEQSGQLFLDVTRILPDRAAAEQLGREQGQLAVFDLAKGEEIRLPGAAPSLGGGPSGVGSGGGPVPVAPPVSAEFGARVSDLKGRLDDVERKLKDVSKLDKPTIGPALKAGLDTRRAGLEAKKAAILDEVRQLQAQARHEEGVKAAEAAPPFDHAAVATNAQVSVQQAAENHQKLTALRLATAQRATERLAAESAAREEADRLFGEAARLREQGEQETALIASLHAMVAKTEADMGKLDGKLGSLRELASKKKLVIDGKAMAMRGLQDMGNGRYAEPWVADAVKSLEEALKPEKVGKLLKTFDRVSSFWRASALLSPGFHERNFLGGLFNNDLAGMDVRRYFDFAVANRQFKRGGLEAIEDPQVREAMAAAMKLGQYEGADISDVSQLIGNGQGGRIIGNQNPLFRANMKAGRVVESNLRMPLFIDTFIKSGGNEQVALDAVMTYHFDYEDLSRFERTVTRRTFAFYTWTRKNLPLQLLNMADQPGKYTRYLAIKRNVELGTPEDAVVPSFFARQLAIRLPFTSDGGRIYAMPETPFVNASDALSVEQLAASLNPVLKTPLEALTNHKFFEQRSFKTNLEQAPNTWVPILQVLRAAGGRFGLPRVYKASDGTLMMSEHEAAKIESLVPVLARLRRLAPSEQKYQDRALTSWLSFAFGVSARTLDQSTIGGEELRRQAVSDRQAALAAQLAGGQKLAAYKAQQAAAKRAKAAAQGR